MVRGEGLGEAKIMPILPAPEASRTPERELAKLRRAISRSNLGVPSSLPLERAANMCLSLLGEGGRVNLDAPNTVRRAITVIRNAGESA